jgi:hypothetical protein
MLLKSYTLRVEPIAMLEDSNLLHIELIAII